MSVFVISDTHFYHKNIIKYCNRPFESVEEMNGYIIKRWNKEVEADDTVYHLGDVMIGSKKQLRDVITRLNGNKILIMGNHDTLEPRDYINNGFDRVIYPNHTIEYCGYSFMMAHDPAFSEIFSNNSDCDIFLHGHVHNLYENIGNRIFNVSVEVNDYTPTELTYFIDVMKGEV